MIPDTVLIIGTGVAGLSTAEGLRRRGFEGSITLVGDEEHPPYDRPPLSKKVLDGSWAPERASLFNPERLQALRADFLLGHSAVRLDEDARVVLTSQGAVLPYDALVIATGLRARTLSGEQPNVLTLRSLDDSLRLAQQLRVGAQLVVVGGGFLGLEVAATARGLGVDVTVVEPFPESLVHKIGSTAASRLMTLHEQRGVRIVGGEHVAEVNTDRDGRATSVRLSGGREIPVDVVLAALGATPDLEWLDDSTLLVEDGVVCDEYCRAADRVWAAGDVARWLHPRLEAHIRLEHRQGAWDQGDAVAANILGPGTAYQPVPFFWTEQFDVRIQVAGFLQPGLSSRIVDEDPERGSFIDLQSTGDVVEAVVAWNAPRAFRDHRAQLVHAQTSPLCPHRHARKVSHP